jgi:hypothetical protein
MTRPMAFPIKFWAVLLICLLTYQFSASVSADNCKYEKDIDLALGLSGSELLAVAAAAGRLEITGVPGTGEARIRAKACTSKEAWLEDSNVDIAGGKRARIAVVLPTDNGGWFSIGNDYAYIDLVVEVPDDMPLAVADSSGGMWLKNIADLEIDDSSGEIEISGARGSITISDSSGDIDIAGAAGNVTIESDSSGDIYGEDIDGAVLVEKDSSGDIRFSDVGKDVVVERDSSGDIKVEDIGGDFRVLKDGSGSISSYNVKGEVVIPEDR